jgi:hypothetical protein
MNLGRGRYEENEEGKVFEGRTGDAPLALRGPLPWRLSFLSDDNNMRTKITQIRERTASTAVAPGGPAERHLSHATRRGRKRRTAEGKEKAHTRRLSELLPKPKQNLRLHILVFHSRLIKILQNQIIPRCMLDGWRRGWTRGRRRLLIELVLVC